MNNYKKYNTLLIVDTIIFLYFQLESMYYINLKYLYWEPIHNIFILIYVKLMIALFLLYLPKYFLNLYIYLIFC